jgi:hypothetical protein
MSRRAGVDDIRFIEGVEMTELLGIKELAALLKVSASTLHKHAAGIKRCQLLIDLPAPALRGRKTL